MHGAYLHSFVCLHGVAWLKTGTILHFHQFSIYIIYLFVYCLLVYNGISSHLTYNPLVSNGGWLMNGALYRMWWKRSQPLWAVNTIFWMKEVKTQKFSVKKINFLAKIWTRNSRMWGLMLSILTFARETSVCLDDNYWFCHFQERLFRNWQIMCQSKPNIKLWLRGSIQVYMFSDHYRVVHKIRNVSTKKFKTKGVLQSHRYNYLIGFMWAVSNFWLFVSLCAKASTFN
jgi:hypothetical protein